MINDLDETIRQLILTKGQFAPDSVIVSFDQPTGDWAASLTRPAINLYLYDMRENLELRSQEWLVERNAEGQAAKRLAPKRYNLSYLVTVWTQKQVEDEHAILWRVLATLASHPTLQPGACQGELKRQPYPILTQAAQPSMAVQNLPDLWGVMENQLRPSFDYVVTVAMDREVVFTSPLVLTKRLEVSSIGGATEGASPGEEIIQIAGIVHRRGPLPEPVPGAQVTLVGTGHTMKSDRYGRYSFVNLSAGNYRVQVAVEGRRVEHQLAVPTTRHDAAHYDLEV